MNFQTGNVKLFLTPGLMLPDLTSSAKHSPNENALIFICKTKTHEQGKLHLNSLTCNLYQPQQTKRSKIVEKIQHHVEVHFNLLTKCYCFSGSKFAGWYPQMLYLALNTNDTYIPPTISLVVLFFDCWKRMEGRWLLMPYFETFFNWREKFIWKQRAPLCLLRSATCYVVKQFQIV